MRFATVAACLGAAALATPAQGQDVIALSLGTYPTLEFGCGGAGVVCRITPRFDDFMLEFTGRPWKLVIIEWYTDLTPDRKARLLPALRDHLDGGGRLLLVYTPLDEWPELQELVGVRTTFDVGPILDRRIWSVDPPHPTWSPHSLDLVAECLSGWEDSGDYLDPDSGGYVLAEWDDPAQSPAMTLTRSGLVLTAGFEYDAFCTWGISTVAQRQIDWLLTCHADVDGDGELTFFDFLGFQNLFAAGDPASDFAFDGRLDFFDFLEFQNQFAAGCP